MSLKMTYGSGEEIPEEFRSLYSERDGLWQLTGVEGICPAAERDELKQALQTESAARRKTDDAFRQAGIAPGELLQFASEHETLHQELETLRTRLEKEQVERALIEAARVCGVRSEAIPDVLARSPAFHADKDQRIVCQINGAERTPDEWLKEQLKSSRHWLQPSRSGHTRPLHEHDSFPELRHTPAVAELVEESWNNTHNRKG